MHVEKNKQLMLFDQHIEALNFDETPNDLQLEFFILLALNKALHSIDYIKSHLLHGTANSNEYFIAKRMLFNSLQNIEDLHRKI